MIKVKGLKFKYFDSKNYAVNDVSFQIDKGKYVAIVGHNGSGKSTLSKLLVGLFSPDEGSISIDNIKLAKKTIKKARKKIGIVFQNPDNQFVGSSVEDDIAFGLENKGLNRKEMRRIVLESAKQVGMEKHLAKQPQNLSGGQKQRVAIASIMALDPEIIIFDEITSMLDPKGKKEVVKIIESIKKSKGKTLVSVTHNMDEAVLADEVIVLAQGRLIAKGNPRDILNDKKIISLAKIDAPFIYKLSSRLKNVKNTYSEKELIQSLCK